MSQIDALIKEIDSKRTEFKTESYPMSIGEIASLYERKEILINPDFQRYFRWTDYQKSKLIESILLGIPIPSVFVYQNDDGIWEVVDGLQRISTILQFMGVLEGKPKLVLEGTKYLPSLQGIVWENPENNEFELASPLKLFIKRSKLNVSIILNESGKNAKFDVFQRLNTGGSFASDQEVRNSVMIMVKKDIYTWFKNLAENENFLETISLSDRLIDEQYPMELVLRFISLLHYRYDSKKELKDFFDDIIEQILLDTDFKYDIYKEEFELTFKLLNQVAGENVFKRYDGQAFKGKFLESAFEAIAVGVGFNLKKYAAADNLKELAQKIKDLHAQDTFRKNTGSGSNAKTRINKVIPFSKEYFA